MLHLLIFQDRDRNSTGYTTVEILTVLIVVGIMCAIAAPSLLAIQGTAKLNNSLEKVRAALEITQFRASQKKKDELGNTCRAYIPANSNKIIGNCLISSDTFSSGVSDNTDDSLIISSGIAKGTLPRSLDGWSVINLDDGVTVQSIQPNEAATGLAGDPPRIVYNLQGITQNGGMIVLGSNVTSDKRCLQINAGVGLIRSGRYANNTCAVTE